MNNTLNITTRIKDSKIMWWRNEYTRKIMRRPNIKAHTDNNDVAFLTGVPTWHKAF